jgi:hypothetical protein
MWTPGFAGTSYDRSLAERENWSMRLLSDKLSAACLSEVTPSIRFVSCILI